MNYPVLVAELALPEYEALSDAETARRLNAKAVVAAVSQRVTLRTLLDKLGIEATAVILATFEKVAESMPVLGIVLDWIKRPESEGIDFGHAHTRKFFDDLLTGEAITAEQHYVLKSLGETLISRAEELGLGEVNDGHVTWARKYPETRAE